MTTSDNKPEETRAKLNFIEQIIEQDIKAGKNEAKVHTRFPPEPNGYLHIGHAKSICLNFGIADKYNGECNLRFDDTNPVKEDVEYVDSIIEDVKWLGFDWEDRLYFASDYFDQMYDFAIRLIKEGKAYVCELTAEEVSTMRGTPQKPSQPSPYRVRTVEENLDLFKRMKDGEFEDGSKTLRAKIDLASANMQLRDPAIYRIRHTHHHRTGDKWCIYPMYDWAHGLEDSIENITHSLCTLEFENHRPLYDWFLNQLEVHHPQQIEFARLNLTYTVMSKRKLLQLVEDNLVNGWDDPRMPTIGGMRRRGFTPASLRNFSDTIGIAKRDNIIDVALLEHHVREDLNKVANRVMGVLDPLKVVITNYPEGQTEEVEAINNPEDESAGTRMLPFSREIYIERSDYMEDAPKKFFRMTLGKEVRLKYAYFATCNEVIKDEDGKIIELRCTYDPLSKGGKSPDGRKVKGAMHWVDASDNVEAEIRLYDRLFTVESPDTDKEKDFKEFLNPDSLNIIEKAYVERSVKGKEPLTHYQFERTGYFNIDKDSTDEKMVFNRTVGLKGGFDKK
ncbi:glutamine--tRNA ligase/YqeY domain fusion protein [Lentimicrobium sp. S6]|uniref:glutamine--tRNA ligase/YqeY domain fusion protein n=1 Tax=Lentimicrobium sp. S6 TaxID=2735872 RepID=UPI0015539340|nr:glutamine--tRNA ligase/YqeY domain fusion protein [Lentimicrobium sp. S6]NPD44168.1 glutamine--tRNA ligase/YqeY domain fusion protein [Lentimicrobium sp. S6]